MRIVRPYIPDTLYRIFLWGILSSLTACEMEVVINRFVFEKSLRKCASRLWPRVTIERVRQIEVKAKKKIKRYLQTESGKLNYGR